MLKQHLIKMAGFVSHNSIQALGNSKTGSEQVIWVAVIMVIFFSGLKKAIAQVRITGHVFAEIVDPAALTSNTNNDYMLIDKDILVNRIELGEITLNEIPTDRVVEINIYSYGLNGRKGNSYPFYTFQCAEYLTEKTNRPKKEKVFKFAGVPDKNIVSGGYYYVEGKFKVVFSYN